MKLINKTAFLFLLIFVNESYAEKMLNPPQSQPPECHHSYEDATQPKTANNVLLAMRTICLRRGGLRVMHHPIILTGSKEPAGYIFSCIGDNPNVRIFSCQFGTSYENL